MKTTTQPITLPNTTSQRLAKRAALSTYRALRAIGH